MSKRLRIHPAEAAFLLVAVILGVLAIYGASTMPPPFFEKLGPAAFPRSIGIVILVLVALKIAGLVVRRGTSPASPAASGETARSPDYRKAAGMFALMCLYLAVLSWRVVDFRVVTGAFLFAGMWLAAGRSGGRKLAIMLAACVLLALALDLLFRHLFYLDL